MSEDTQNTYMTKLPMDVRKQAAILGHLLVNKKFFEYAHNKIRPDWFNDPRHSKIYKLQKKFRAAFGRAPTPEEVSFHPDFVAEDPPELNSLRASIKTCIMESANFGLDALQMELTEWLHARIFREGIDQSVKAFNGGKFQECYQIVQQKIKEIQETTFNEDIQCSFEGPSDYLLNAEHSNQNSLTTGLRIFDDALAPGGDSRGMGALARGATTILLAPVNIGKTTTMITMAVHNARKFKNILYMTHEGVPEDIRIQFLCNFLRVDRSTLMEMYKTPEGLAKVEKVVQVLKKHVTYIPYNKPGMTIEDVLPIIQRRQDMMAAQNNGRGYDMLVVDYPALLSTVQARGGKFEKRNIDDYVYKTYTQLALDLDLHCLLAIQTNRQGSKDNRDGSRLLTMEDVMESWGPMASATNVISINRDAMAEKNHRVTFYVAKSRSSRRGAAIVAKSNYACSVSHAEDLGGTYYYGTDPMSDRIDDLLTRFKGRAIDEHQYRSNE